MACCELLLKNSKKLLEKLGWLMDVNLAIVDLPTNYFIKKNCPNNCNFYVQQLNIQIF